MKLSTSVTYFDHRLQVFLIYSSFVCVPNEYFKYKKCSDYVHNLR